MWHIAVPTTIRETFIMMQLSPRFTLQIDTVTCGAMAALLLVLAGPLGGRLDLPADLLRWVGVGLLPWTALLAWFATRAHVTRDTMQFVVGVNVAWVVASIGLLVSGQVGPNAWGVWFVVVQAVAVAVLAGVQAKVLPTTPRQQPAM